MAKLFARVEDERGIEVHKIANRELCANFYYGSREHSVRAVRVCARITPSLEPAVKEEAIFTVDFFSPEGKTIHSYTETYPMPVPIKIVKAMV
ncbi:MAG: hypothetical protein NZ932_03875 [Candidatus Bathyarchaeota archaeon]|nr:hypothetical protein [Candidatus Bathyarchaeota archaeon]MDW8022393.1 hypothetical protein [Nitrososphaerota archaeon]